jgi:hypothetical protein
MTEKLNETFLDFSLEIVADVMMGIFLGIMVNWVATYLGRAFNLSFLATILVQFLLICMVLYLLKINADYLYKAWEDASGYGIIFTGVFLGVQRNLINFFENVYHQEQGLDYLFDRHDIFQ